MLQFLVSALSAIPAAATSELALVAYALVIGAYIFTVWRVARNKNLLANLEKLPAKDRLRALESEMGGVPLAAGISPEQWVQNRIHRYYLVAFLATCALVAFILALAVWRGGGASPVIGSVFIGNPTVINNQIQHFNNNQPPSSADLQQIQEAINLATQRQFERARDAFNQLPEIARVPAVLNNLGVVYEGLNDPESARRAYQKALDKSPDYGPAKANLTRLGGEDSAAGSPAKAVALATPPVNLLAPDQGGQAKRVPKANWQGLISGKEDDYVTAYNGDEAVYGFRQDRPATFSRFAILIKEASQYNPKEIEILAANELQSEAFRSLRRCTIENALIVGVPYQECDFPETTAKYVKIRLVSGYGSSWTYLTQIRVLGRPAQ
jgi:tetratricopeptide (TPR) repeat protein